MWNTKKKLSEVQMHTVNPRSKLPLKKNVPLIPCSALPSPASSIFQFTHGQNAEKALCTGSLATQASTALPFLKKLN